MRYICSQKQKPTCLKNKTIWQEIPDDSLGMIEDSDTLDYGEGDEVQEDDVDTAVDSLPLVPDSWLEDDVADSDSQEGGEVSGAVAPAGAGDADVHAAEGPRTSGTVKDPKDPTTFDTMPMPCDFALPKDMVEPEPSEHHDIDERLNARIKYLE